METLVHLVPKDPARVIHRLWASIREDADAQIAVTRLTMRLIMDIDGELYGKAYDDARQGVQEILLIAIDTGATAENYLRTLIGYDIRTTL